MKQPLSSTWLLTHCFKMSIVGMLHSAEYRFIRLDVLSYNIFLMALGTRVFKIRGVLHLHVLSPGWLDVSKISMKQAFIVKMVHLAITHLMRTLALLHHHGRQQCPSQLRGWIGGMPSQCHNSAEPLIGQRICRQPLLWNVRLKTNDNRKHIQQIW